MTVVLQVVLIVVSLLTLIFITCKVRDSKVRIEDSIFWVCFAGLLFILSIFPGVFDVLSRVVGVYSTANFVFLLFIFILLVQSFRLSIRVSQADTKIKELTQQLAIEKFERHNNSKDKNCAKRDRVNNPEP